MKAEDFRKFQEATANMGKVISETLKEFRKAGLRRKEAIEILKILLINFKNE